MSDTSKPGRATRPKWGLAVLGMLAVGAAVGVQFCVPTSDGEKLATLPGFVQSVLAAVGKLGLTVPLVVLGLGLLSRAAIKNMHRGTPSAATPTVTQKERVALAPQPDEEMFAEEIEDESDPPVPNTTPSSGGKVRAKLGKPKPAGAATPFRNPTGDGGTVALSSAKYLNNGKPEFRKGETRASFD